MWSDGEGRQGRGPGGEWRAESPDRVPDDWYDAAFGEEYLEVYRARDDAQAEAEVAAAAALLGLAHGDLVLDLCCGAGRHLGPLLARRIRAVGLDRSADLLRRARARGDGCGAAAAVVRGDMRRLPFVGDAQEADSRLDGERTAARFDAVLSFFTSFGYFRDEDDHRRVLEEIHRVLRPGGDLLLDLMDRDTVVRDLVPESVREERGRLLRERRWISADGRRVEKEVRVIRAGRDRRHFESVRMFDREEIESLLRRCDLIPVACHGDLGVPPRAPSPYEPGTSARMIVHARRPRSGAGRS